MSEEHRGKGRPRYSTMEALVSRGKCPATWKEDIIALGARGRNKLHFANYLNISRDLMYRIMERDPDFSGTIKKALELSQQWWIDRGLESFEDGKSKNLNSTFWKYYMENVYRDDWRPAKEELDITTNGNSITDNQIVVEIVKQRTDEEKKD